MPARNNGYWNETAPLTDFPRLTGEVRVDVAIVGGGIVGVSAARFLKDAGRTVAVVEAHRVGRQVTGKSTAKVTSQHNIIYQTLEQKFDGDKARLYAEAQEAGIRTIRQLAGAYKIDADLEAKPAYTWTCEQSLVSQIEEEAEAARRLGLPATLTRETELPFDVLAALRFDDQAAFHPTKYVAGLAQTIPGDGSHVFENSRVTDWSPSRVATKNGAVVASHVIMATHLPLGQIGGYYSQAHPYAEPVIAAPIARPLDGMYMNVEQPSHSIRTHRRADGKFYAIAGGSQYKPGHTDEERKYFEDIERWLNKNFEVGPIEYRWVNEDYISMDKAPFVGWSSSGGDRFLVATGFGAWGLSNGTAAGMMLSDLACGKENPWLAMFDATRVKPIAAAPQFVKENLQIATHLVSGYLSRNPHNFEKLGFGDAGIVEIDGKKIAAFRDESGNIHAVSAACSHMGCLLGWNETDRTWDCACHGSRFGLDGEVIHGPATTPLELHAAVPRAARRRTA